VTTPPERILSVFSGMAPDAREILGEALELQCIPFLSSIGSSLLYPPKLANMVLKCALKRVSWDGSAVLVDRLSDNEPWLTVRTCLVEALEGPPVAQLRGGNNS
jgi:hypothetical protein